MQSKELRDAEKLVIDYIGGDFDLDKLIKTTNTYISLNIVNETESNDVYKYSKDNDLKLTGRSLIYYPETLGILINYSKLHYSSFNSMFIWCGNSGFIIIDLDTIKNKTLIIKSHYLDTGIIIGKQGKAVKELLKDIQQHINNLNMKYELTYIKVVND